MFEILEPTLKNYTIVLESLTTEVKFRDIDVTDKATILYNVISK